MANETIGHVVCRFCDADAQPVRKNKKGKLYYVCRECGIVQPNSNGFQDWILNHAELWPEGNQPEPAAAPVAEASPDPEPAAPAPEPEPARGFFPDL